MIKKMILLAVWTGIMPLSLYAQNDDLYFIPKRSTEKADTDKSQTAPSYRSSYRDIDEYNRRTPAEPAEEKRSACRDRDRRFDDDYDDYTYSQRMRRFDGYYGWNDYYYNNYWDYDPYWYGYYSFYRPWPYTWYGPRPYYWYSYRWRYPYYDYGWRGYYYDYEWSYPGYYAPRYYYYGGVRGTRNHGDVGRRGGDRLYSYGYDDFSGPRRGINATGTNSTRSGARDATDRGGNFSGSRSYDNTRNTNTPTRDFENRDFGNSNSYFVLDYGQILHIYSIEFHPNLLNFILRYGKI